MVLALTHARARARRVPDAPARAQGGERVHEVIVQRGRRILRVACEAAQLGRPHNRQLGSRGRRRGLLAVGRGGRRRRPNRRRGGCRALGLEEQQEDVLRTRRSIRDCIQLAQRHVELHAPCARVDGE